MKLLLILAALAMPVIAWFSQQGTFGPDNGTISDRYPTLIVAAGYAFAIWGPIFALDLGFAVWQALTRQRTVARQRLLHLLTALGFALTASWMIVFSQQWFWLALIVIWGALACMVGAAWLMARDAGPRGASWLGRVPVGLHAGWLSLAVFLNTAQVIVAFRLLPTTEMLPWSLALWAVAGVVLLCVNAALRGHPAYGVAVLWGLVGVYVKQSNSPLIGASSSGHVALGLAALVLVQTALLTWRAQARQQRTFS